MRLRGTVELARSLPSLLGFRPRDSLVLVGTCVPPAGRQASGRQSSAVAGAPGARTVRCAMRVDLPPRVDPQLTTELLARAATAGADEVLAVVVDGPPGPPSQWHAALTGVDCGPRVVDTLGLTGSRVWSAGCNDPLCCPPEGLVVPAEAPADLAAEMALHGRDVLPDRQALVDSVRPSQPPTDRQDDADPAQLLRRLRARRWQSFTAGDWAAAGRQCREVTYRDAVLMALEDLPPDESVGCALQLARAVGPADDDAGACAVLAWLAWRTGDGALARVAVERGLGSDPGHRLCGLLEQVLDAGVPPDAS